jgi:hypothetical protein
VVVRRVVMVVLATIVGAFGLVSVGSATPLRGDDARPVASVGGAAALAPLTGALCPAAVVDNALGDLVFERADVAQTTGFRTTTLMDCIYTFKSDPPFELHSGYVVVQVNTDPDLPFIWCGKEGALPESWARGTTHDLIVFVRPDVTNAEQVRQDALANAQAANAAVPCDLPSGLPTCENTRVLAGPGLPPILAACNKVFHGDDKLLGFPLFPKIKTATLAGSDGVSMAVSEKERLNPKQRNKCKKTKGKTKRQCLKEKVESVCYSPAVGFRAQDVGPFGSDVLGRASSVGLLAACARLVEGIEKLIEEKRGTESVLLSRSIRGDQPACRVLRFRLRTVKKKGKLVVKAVKRGIKPRLKVTCDVSAGQLTVKVKARGTGKLRAATGRRLQVAVRSSATANGPSVLTLTQG